MAALFKAVNLEVKYHTRQATLSALHNVSFEVNRGQIVGLVGESGCGKSTIASAVMRLLPPNGEISAGQLLLDGQDLCQASEDEMRKMRGSKISMIFQDPIVSLNPVFTIEDQMVDAILAHPPEDNRPISRKEALQRAIFILDKVGIPDAAQQIHNFPHQFSGGMCQRIMIASALQSKPALLIADEPTSALDVTLEAQITDLIRQLRDELQTSILYITHDLGVVAQICDQVVVLYAGNVVETGDVFSLFKNPLHPYTQALLRSHPSHQTRARRLITIRGRVPSLKELPVGCKFAPRCDLAEAICFAEEPQPWSPDGARTVLCHAYAPHWTGKSAQLHAAQAGVELEPAGQTGADAGPAGLREEVARADQVKVYFKDTLGWLGKILGQKEGLVRAVDGVDIAVYRGETLALVGESGSGKTTLGKTILRLERPSQGDVSIAGQDITVLPQSQIRPLRAGMQMIFQDPISSLSPRKTVSELVLEPFSIHGIPVNKAEKTNELLEMVGLSTEQADKYPHQLSGGQARRVGIARALALHPALLVADEPTAGLDVSVAAGILNLMKDLRERLGLGYLLITHNLNIIGFIADRVAVMYLGKIVEVAATQDLFDSPQHPYSEALLSAVAMPDPTLRQSRKRILLEGEIPSPRNPPPGCPFHPRCRYRQDICSIEAPLLKPVAVPGSDQTSQRLVACHFPLSNTNPG